MQHDDLQSTQASLAKGTITTPGYTLDVNAQLHDWRSTNSQPAWFLNGWKTHNEADEFFLKNLCTALDSFEGTHRPLSKEEAAAVVEKEAAVASSENMVRPSLIAAASLIAVTYMMPKVGRGSIWQRYKMLNYGSAGVGMAVGGGIVVYGDRIRETKLRNDIRLKRVWEGAMGYADDESDAGEEEALRPRGGEGRSSTGSDRHNRIESASWRYQDRQMEERVQDSSEAESKWEKIRREAQNGRK